MGYGTGCAVTGCFIEGPHGHRLETFSYPTGPDPRDERIRTLEDALRPFAEDRTPFGHHPRPMDSANCVCGDPRPCKYETARRALEGEG